MESDTQGASAKVSPLLAGAVVIVLAIFSAWVVNADLSADYPLGDGGLFYVIVRQILAGHFAYPQAIAYNGLQIPFAYSPLAFYCVAAIVKLTAIPIPKAMNLWVFAWSLLFAPAAYLAARRFLETQIEALIATAFAIIFPPNVAWLAMGGGVTRAPGFVFFLLASGFTWEAFRKGRRSSAVFAGLCAAASLWFHMEFAFLYAATFVIFVVFTRPPIRIAGGIVAVSLVLALPWIVIASVHFHAAFEAAHTSRGLGFTLESLLYYSGILNAAWLPLTGFICMLAACFIDRNYLWLVWGAAIVYLDSRAGFQAAHLPSALAIGWGAGNLIRSLGSRLGRIPLTLLIAIAFLAAAGSARDDSSRYVRLSTDDARDMTWMDSHLDRSADVLTLDVTAFNDALFRDQTFEWVPALTGLRSSITYQGLEWVSSQQNVERNLDFFQLEWCVPQGPGCILDFVRRKAPGNTVYVYVPAHGRAYPVLIAALGSDPHFARVFQSSTSTVFKVEQK